MAKTGPANPIVTQQWQDIFIDAYSKTMNIRASCEAAGVTRMTVNKYQRTDAAFAERMRLAKEDAVDILEDSALQRARDGYENVYPVYYRGQWVGNRVERRFSDGLAEFFLRSHRREIYNPPTRTEVTGRNGNPIEIEVTLEERKLHLTRSVQALINIGMNLIESLQYLAVRGVAADDLKLIDGSDLEIPVTTNGNGHHNGNGNGNGNGHAPGNLVVDITPEEDDDV